MTVARMDHAGVIVDDLAAATEFVVELGLERTGGGTVGGRPVDRLAVADGLRARGTELVGELVDYEGSFWLRYVRGPEAIIVELAEKIV